MAALKILLVDGSPAFLSAASYYLAGKPDVEVVGQAASLGEALEQVTLLSPDVVLTDLPAPVRHSLEEVARLKALPQAPRVIVVTAQDEPAYRALAEALPVDGFIAKQDFCTHLLPLLDGLLV
jgi:DNA-binding NarL/FixJ family response regulator